MKFHTYADDTHIYGAFQPDESDDAIQNSNWLPYIKVLWSMLTEADTLSLPS
jgi:hypothetical protein